MPEEKKLRKRSSAGQDPTPVGRELLDRASGAQFDNPTSRALETVGVQRMPQSFAPVAPEHSPAVAALQYFPGFPPGAEPVSYAPYSHSGSESGLSGSPAERMMLATSLINPLIERAEKAIASLGFFVTATVLLETDDTKQWARYLRFGKEGKEWCLTVESGVDGEDEDRWTHARLHTASRETRLKALSLLPELVDALSGRAEEQACSALQIVTDATSFIASLERTPQ